MHSCKQLERVLEKQCNVTGSDDTPVAVKPPKEIPSSSLQNPSDPDAAYSGHKGQGYQVQLMETYRTDEEKKVVADSLYGSDENCEKAKEQGVELIAPLMGTPPGRGPLPFRLYSIRKRPDCCRPKGLCTSKDQRKKGANQRFI